MIQDEFQDSNSSRDGDDELVIKPPQTSSEVHSVVHHKEKERKKKRHSKESNKRQHRHHHHHRDNLKNTNVNFSNRNKNMESKHFHYRDNKRTDQSRVSEDNFIDEDNDTYGVRSKNPIKNISDASVENDTESIGERSAKYEEITDVRHKKFVKDVREIRRYRNRNEERNTYFLDEMKVEWRKKRLQWLQHQHQKNQDGRPCNEKDLESKICDKEFDDHNGNIHTEYSGTEKKIANDLQIKDKSHCSHNFLVSSEEDNMDSEENVRSEELTDLENDHISNQEDTAMMLDNSDINSNAANKATSEELSEGTGSTSENEKFVSKKKSLPVETAEETKTVIVFKKENQNAKPDEKNGILLASKDNTLKPKLPVYCPAIQGCRSIDGFTVLNRIEEGTYGVVYRARDKQTKEIVALKRLKMEREKEGFPITSLREINTLLKAQHPNIVTVREIVVGSNMDRIYIVMDYVEHDLKSLMKTMPRPFLIGEVKTLLMQLLCAVAHLHDNWILHRDLKTSNLLLSHQGILKVGDFGLAREYGSPLKSYTPVVVTLWYRAPELLLGAKKYSTPIDMWSVGCIFGELLNKNALFPGKSESDQINRIFKDLGTPSENIWPGYNELPVVQSINITQYPYNNLKSRFPHTFTDVGFDLLNRFLTYNPARRISAEKAKSHEFFSEQPRPVPPNMFPTWPSKSELEYRKARSSPKPPLGGIHYSRQ